MFKKKFKMFQTEYCPNRTALIEGEEYLFFAGTAYLGMPACEEFKNYVWEGITKYGVNYGTSRTSTLGLAIYEQGEKQIAEYMNCEAVLTLSSGYLAGQLAIHWLTSQYPDYQVLYSPNTHPAVKMPTDKTLPLADNFEKWTEKMIENISQSSNEGFIVVTDSVASLKGKTHKFDWVKNLPTNKKIWLFIDDSHGIGVIGKHGKGVLTLLPEIPKNVELMVLASFGKALGMPTGCIFTCKEVIESMKDVGFFRGASPTLPAYLYAFGKSAHLYQQKHADLMENCQYFVEKLVENKVNHLFTYEANYPIFYVLEHKLHEFLLARKILIPSFAYPNKDSPLITRIVLNALHSKADLDKTIEEIVAFAQKISKN